MGLLSANLKAALKRAGAQPVWLLELALPGGTKRYSIAGASSAAYGAYRGRVLSIGSLGRSIDIRTNGLALSTMSVIIADDDADLSKIIEGASGNAVRNSVATILLGEVSTATADWLTVRSGRVDSFSQPEPRRWQIDIRRDDLPLQRESIPKGIVTAGDWPNAASATWGARYPIVYGKHDSVSGTNAGAVPCLLVDSLSFKYLVGSGHLKAVSRVYVDGVPTSTSNWSASYPTVNGRLVTVVTFTSSQADADVSCDCEGLTSVSDGTGTLLEDPPTVLAHMLHNFIYGDWKSGAWLTTTAPVDATTFATTFFSQRSVKVARHIAGAQTGLAATNELLESIEAKGYWTTAGKIGIRALDPAAFAYGDEPFIRPEDIQGWILTYPTSDIIDRVAAAWGYDSSSREYQQSLEVRDVPQDASAPESIDLPWSPASVV